VSIAVVEDDPNMRILFNQYLDTFTEQSRNMFREAGELLDWVQDLTEPEKRDLDLVLMDIELPDINGITATERLKSDSILENLPILMITALDDVENLREAFDAGCMDYITKPLTKIEFEARVKSALRLKQALDRERELANRDALTGLYNRRYFNDQMDTEFRRARRDQEPISFIICDIDYFKQYNDTYGHSAGDVALKKVSEVLESTTRRPGDIVARYGGEEFAVILPNTDNTGAENRAETIRKEVESAAIEHQASEVSDVLTLSIGVSSVTPGEEATAKILIKDADDALYRAKESGRNRVEVSEPELQP
jgi:two-component system chemotaxis family response regulator WspR